MHIEAVSYFSPHKAGRGCVAKSLVGFLFPITQSAVMLLRDIIEGTGTH